MVTMGTVRWAGQVWSLKMEAFTSSPSGFQNKCEDKDLTCPVCGKSGQRWKHSQGRNTTNKVILNKCSLVYASDQMQHFITSSFNFGESEKQTVRVAFHSLAVLWRCLGERLWSEFVFNHTTIATETNYINLSLLTVRWEKMCLY